MGGGKGTVCPCWSLRALVISGIGLWLVKTWSLYLPLAGAASPADTNGQRPDNYCRTRKIVLHIHASYIAQACCAGSAAESAARPLGCINKTKMHAVQCLTRTALEALAWHASGCSR